MLITLLFALLAIVAIWAVVLYVVTRICEKVRARPRQVVWFNSLLGIVTTPTVFIRGGFWFGVIHAGTWAIATYLNYRWHRRRVFGRIQRHVLAP